jgi:hypothetical protein
MTDRLTHIDPLADNGSTPSSMQRDAGVAARTYGEVIADEQHALLAVLEARLTNEVLRLVGALRQFGDRAQLIGEELPGSAQFSKAVTSLLTLLSLQMAIALGKGLDTPIFVDDGRQYLADLGLSLNDFVREVDLDGRRFLAVALIDKAPDEILAGVEAGEK